MKFYQYFVVLFVLLECQLKKKMNKFYDIMYVSSVIIFRLKSCLKLYMYEHNFYDIFKWFFSYLWKTIRKKPRERLINFWNNWKSILLFNACPYKIEKLTFHKKKKKNHILTFKEILNIYMLVVSTQSVPSCLFY